jgi:protein disulfide-isomerase A1
VEYTGGRTKDTIISWVNKRSGQASQELLCDEIAPTTSLNKLNLVFFGDFHGSFYNSFTDIAKFDEKFKFYHASGDCAREHGAKHNTVSIFRTFDKSPLHFAQSDKTTAAIESWMEKATLPVLVEFAAEFIEPVLKRSSPSIILFTNEVDTAFRSVFKEAAEALYGEIVFVVSGTKTGIQKRLAEFSLVTDEMTPSILILQPGGQM